jgi:hypothetical protein
MIEAVLSLEEAKHKAFLLGQRRAGTSLLSYEDKHLLALLKEMFVFGYSQEVTRMLIGKWYDGLHSK